MKRPKRITVIGAIFMIAGCLAAWKIAYSAFNGHINLNLGVFMLPVGCGLLKGRSSSRTWAKVWIILFSFMAALLLVLYPFMGESYSITWFEEELAGLSRDIMAISIPICLIMGGIFMHRMLSTQSVAPFFDDYITKNAEQAGAPNPTPAPCSADPLTKP